MPIRDIVLTIFIFGMLPVCLLRPWIGVMMWYWLGFMNPHKLSWTFATDMPFAQMVAIVTLIGLILTRERKPIPWNFELGMIVLLFLHFTVTSFLAWYPSVAWDQWIKVGKILLMSYVTTILIYGKERIRILLMVIALSIGFFGVKGGIFTLTTGGVFSVMGPGNSFIATNVGLGLALVMAIPLMMALARDETRPWLRNVLRITTGLSTLSTVFTYSRGALLGLAAISPFVFLKTKRKFLVLLLLLPLAYFANDLVPKELYERTESIGEYKTDESAQERIQAWSVSWNIAKEKPLNGAGFNFEYGTDDARWLSYADFLVPKADNVARAAHSIFFQVLGQHGFVGLGLFLILMIGSLVRLHRMQAKAKMAPESAWIANYAGAIQIGLIGFLVAGSFVSLAYFDLVYAYFAVEALLERELRAFQPATTAISSQPQGKDDDRTDVAPGVAPSVAGNSRRAG